MTSAARTGQALLGTLDRLVGRYVPNVLGEPFEISREYVELAARKTGSSVLNALLAIIVEAYDKAKTIATKSMRRDVLWEMLAAAVFLTMPRTNHLPDHVLCAALQPDATPDLASSAWASALEHGEQAQSLRFLKCALGEGGNVFVIDQMLLEQAIGLLHPTLKARPCRVLAWNLLERYGRASDLNNDGKIDESERTALEQVPLALLVAVAAMLAVALLALLVYGLCVCAGEPEDYETTTTTKKGL